MVSLVHFAEQNQNIFRKYEEDQWLAFLNFPVQNVIGKFYLEIQVLVWDRYENVVG
jgi:hypothetical protein